MPVARPVNALEVRYLDKLVGWLSDFDGANLPGSRVIRLDTSHASIVEEGVYAAEPHIESYCFTLGKMQYSISAKETSDRTQANITRNVAPYAERFKEIARDYVYFVWDAVKLDTFELYEWIFDYPYFISNDGPRDFDVEHHEAASMIAVEAIAERDRRYAEALYGTTSTMIVPKDAATFDLSGVGTLPVGGRFPPFVDFSKIS